MPKETSFIPTIWSARILNTLEKSLVFSQLFNSDYEGEITEYGDTVKIGAVGVPTIKKYTPESDIEDPEAAAVTETTLTIDGADYFNISVDDVYETQSRVDLLDAATARTGYAFADAADKYLAGKVLAAATAVSSASTNAYDVLVDLSSALTSKNVPNEGRVAIVSPDFEAALRKDSRIVAVGTGESEARLSDGQVYRIAGLTVVVSNNLTEANTVVAGSAIGGTFANQITKVTPYTPEKRFAQAVKGLHLYGAAVLNKDCYVKATYSFSVGE